MPQRTSFKAALLIALFVTGVVSLLAVLTMLPWKSSGGRWPAAGVAVLALLAIRPGLDRAARKIAGVDGPRVFWRIVLGVSLFFAFGVLDAFWSSFHYNAPFAFGAALSAIEGIVPLEIAIGAAAGLALERVLGAVARKRWHTAEQLVVARAAAIVVALVALVACLPLVAKARVAPTAQELVASMSCAGPLPGVTPPSTPPNRPAINPTDAQAYPYVFLQDGAAAGWHAARYCSDTTCVVYAAPATDRAFPPVFESNRFPQRVISDYVDPNDEVFMCQASGVAAMRSKRGMREWTKIGPHFDRIYDPREVTRGLAAPWPTLACLALALGVAMFVAWRPRKDGLKIAGLAGDWVPGTQGSDGLVRFEDGTPPVQVEGTPIPGPVLVVLRAGPGASFREAGAPTVERIFRGTHEDLDEVALIARGADPAYAAAGAALAGAIAIVALYMGLG